MIKHYISEIVGSTVWNSVDNHLWSAVRPESGTNTNAIWGSLRHDIFVVMQGRTFNSLSMSTNERAREIVDIILDIT